MIFPAYRRWRPSVCLATFCLVAAAGCASAPARNFLDTEGPRFAGSFRAGGPTRARAVAINEDPTFSVASYNIKFGEEPDNALETLRNGGLDDVDLLLLQEMTLAATVRIAGSLGFEYVYYPATIHPASGQEFGVAILSPWPIRDDHKIVLPDFVDSRDPAAKVAATGIAWIRGIPVGVVNVHLQLGLSPEQTQEQIRTIVDCTFSERCENPEAPLLSRVSYVVVAGDLNTSNRGKKRAADAILTAAGLRQVPGIGRTFKYLFFGLGKLDHIYTSPTLEVEESGHVRGFFATGSDHHPIYARLRFNGELPQPWQGFALEDPPRPPEAPPRCCRGTYQP